MASYNNYYPAYQQYPVYQQPVVQTQYQPQIQQPVQSNQQIQNVSVWVNDEKEVLSFPIAPNNSVDLHEYSGKRIYVKFADATGKPTIRRYILEEPEPEETKVSTKELPYATKDDLNTIVGVVKDFDKAIVAMKGEIETMKGDLYGIAGKKKPVKKPETEEE